MKREMFRCIVCGVPFGTMKGSEPIRGTSTERCCASHITTQEGIDHVLSLVPNLSVQVIDEGKP